MCADTSHSLSHTHTAESQGARAQGNHCAQIQRRTGDPMKKRKCWTN